MKEPKVNNGISGCLNYEPEMIKELELIKENLMKRYPIVNISIELADITDKRWRNYKNDK
ncbi:MAG: hypothetical protein QXD43_01725 [Candidatus Aenigmatarchaeota archaeon]